MYTDIVVISQKKVCKGLKRSFIPQYCHNAESDVCAAFNNSLSILSKPPSLNQQSLIPRSSHKHLMPNRPLLNSQKFWKSVKRPASDFSFLKVANITTQFFYCSFQQGVCHNSTCYQVNQINSETKKSCFAVIKFSETQPTPASFLPMTSFRSNTPEQAQIEITEHECLRCLRWRKWVDTGN